MKEDLSFKQKTHKSKMKKEYKLINSASGLFQTTKQVVVRKMYSFLARLVEERRVCAISWYNTGLMHRKLKELSEWQKGLDVYDLLFFISLRCVDSTRISVFEMICKDLLKSYPQFHDTVKQILIECSQTAKCLIILDGLDEMKGKPEIDIAISGNTIITTSRQWKFYYIKPSIGDRDKVLEVCGLNKAGVERVIQGVLANYCDIEPNSKGFAAKFNDMKKRVHDRNLKSMMQIPLLLALFVHLWLSPTSISGSNTDIQESITSSFALLLNFLLKIARHFKRVTEDTLKCLNVSQTSMDVPVILKEKEMLVNCFDAILALGKLSYEDLVLKNLDSNGATQLVFRKEKLEKELGEPLLTFALNVGLLSQSPAPGAGDEENVSINFLHKTIEEFLAALYLVCSGEVSFDSFLRDYCSSRESVMELSNVLMFLVGLHPSLGITISKHIAEIANDDTDIIRYRQEFDDNYVDADDDDYGNGDGHTELLFKTLCQFAKEMEYSLSQSKLSSKGQKFLVSDVHIRWDSDPWTIAFATRLLQNDNDTIASLRYYSNREKRCIPAEVVQFLDKSSSLQAFFFGRSVGSLCRMSQISPIFSSLTSLSLRKVSLTSEAGRALQEAIQSNTHIQSLKLEFVQIEPRSKVLKLDLKNNKQLRILYIREIDSVFLLGDITHCKLLVRLCLRAIQVQRANMLQAALSSFTQLKTLQLKELSFSSKITDKLCLDLTDLTDLNLTRIHVDSIQIRTSESSPVSLQNLTISEVPGSLRGLLSILPDCQYIKCLSIGSLSDEDVKLLTDVLPQLPHVGLLFMDFFYIINGKWISFCSISSCDKDDGVRIFNHYWH